MVALQILVLPAQVRVLVPQQIPLVSGSYDLIEKLQQPVAVFRYSRIRGEVFFS